MSRPFYQATARSDGRPPSPSVRLLGGALTSYEDEPLTAGSTAAVAAAESRILLAEIERPRVGPMRDIVATIQPDQDDLVRAPLDETVCVQGAPGTGKTAVGLHRAAYLLYTYPDRLHRTGVLVVGPNRAFLGYIGQVLPALGEMGVTQSTVDELIARVPVRAVDPLEVAALKGDARMAAVLRRAVGRMVRGPTRESSWWRGAVATGSRSSGCAATSTTCAAARSTTPPGGSGCTCFSPRTPAGSGRRPAERRRTPRPRGWPALPRCATSWTRCGRSSTPRPSSSSCLPR